MATAAELGWPLGTAIDSSGNLLFSDYFGNRVQELTSVADISSANVSVSSLTFDAPQALGANVDSQTVTLSNPGKCPLTINRIGISGSSDFTESNHCPPMIASGDLLRNYCDVSGNKHRSQDSPPQISGCLAG
jgi:hypothetical protein